MRLVAVLAVVFGVTAGAVALDDAGDEGPRRILMYESAVTDRVRFSMVTLGEGKPSGIEGLPVPDHAKPTTGDATCTGEPGCREEYWTLAKPFEDAAIHEWYVDLLGEGQPWRDWQPCGDTGASQWFKPDRSLLININGGAIHLRDQAGALPCN